MSKRYLGEPVFVVLPGAIRRTAIDQVSQNSYHLLKYDGNPHFFSFEEAVFAEMEVLQSQLGNDEITLKELQRLREYAERLHSDEYRAEVLAQKLERGPQLMGMIERVTYEEDPVFPKGYIEPGTWVYAIVTPRSHYSLSPGWRPKPYFLLRLKIAAASFAPAYQGALHYRLQNTHYHVHADDLFKSLPKARNALVQRFAEETGGSILPENIVVFTTMQEKRWEHDMMEQLIKQR